ncbi:GmrSD restriction endonuclease domain-containing protein [Enterococcus sp. LJL51]|uniref:GmrSD restriction endonuclease domain-containing protein n=1 Tax=Enterococcus sp. LJL51 TaxID=3416656 RepID=UPI003CF500DA
MVRINKKIVAAVGFNPTKKSHQLSILDMCKYIKRNKITLPLYQRDLSWNVQKSMALLNYQLFGKAPVAPISINQMSTGINAVPQVSFINRELIDSNQIEADHQSVVDGQQRLSTNYKAYTNHEDFRNIFLDVSAAKFKIVDGSIKDYHVPVGVVLNEDDGVLLHHLQEKDLVQELFPILTQVRSKMMSYNYTINIADNLTEDEQIEWFEVLNNAGSRVSALQMSFSKLKLHDFDIYSDYVAPFKEKIQTFGYDELFSPFTTNVSYPVASLNPAFEKVKKNGQHSNNYAPIPSDTKESQITKLTVDDLKKVIELSLGGLDRALSFIQNNDLEEFVDRMDYILYLVGYFIFNDNLDIKTEENLVMWIETIDFSNKSNGERRNIFDKLINNIFDED